MAAAERQLEFLLAGDWTRTNARPYPPAGPACHLAGTASRAGCRLDPWRAHDAVAVRVSDHPGVSALCMAWGGPRIHFRQSRRPPPTAAGLPGKALFWRAAGLHPAPGAVGRSGRPHGDSRPCQRANGSLLNRFGYCSRAGVRIIPRPSIHGYTTMEIEQVKSYLLQLQDNICAELAEEDGGSGFITDEWQRPGVGRSAGCSLKARSLNAPGEFSHVRGASLPSASASRPELAGRSFQAMGTSPGNPSAQSHVPAFHANVRMFVAEKSGRGAGLVVRRRL